MASGSINKVIIVGNLGRDPEIRTTQDGKEIANMVVATSDSWRDKNTGERREKTEWHRVVIFNDGLINICRNYLRKGSKVYLEGALQTRKWVDQSGAEKYTTEIVLQGFNSTLTILDSRNQSSGESSSSSSGGSDYSGNNNFSKQSNNNKPAAVELANQDLDDEIPF